MIAIANNKNGKDENTWIKNEITESTFPPKYPAQTPIVYPITVAIICEMIPTLIVTVTLGIPNAIMSEASLSFLGLGVKAPMASWGSMISFSQPYLFPFLRS